MGHELELGLGRGHLGLQLGEHLLILIATQVQLLKLGLEQLLLLRRVLACSLCALVVMAVVVMLALACIVVGRLVTTVVVCATASTSASSSELVRDTVIAEASAATTPSASSLVAAIMVASSTTATVVTSLIEPTARVVVVVGWLLLLLASLPAALGRGRLTTTARVPPPPFVQSLVVIATVKLPPFNSALVKAMVLILLGDFFAFVESLWADLAALQAALVVILQVRQAHRHRRELFASVVGLVVGGALTAGRLLEVVHVQVGALRCPDTPDTRVLLEEPAFVIGDLALLAAEIYSSLVTGLFVFKLAEEVSFF